MKIITPGMSLSPARSSAAFSSSLSRIITPEKMAASSRPALRATRQEVHVVVAKALSRGPYAGVPCPMSMPMCRPASASLAVSLARSRTAAASAAEVEYCPVHSVAAHLHRHIVSRCLPQRGLPRRRCHVLPLHFAVLIPSAGRLWRLVIQKFNIDDIDISAWQLMGSVEEWWASTCDISTTDRKAKASITMLVSWVIWNERNARVFRHKSAPSPILLNTIVAEKSMPDCPQVQNNVVQQAYLLGNRPGSEVTVDTYCRPTADT